jgi:hypothetical protein
VRPPLAAAAALDLMHLRTQPLQATDTSSAVVAPARERR